MLSVNKPSLTETGTRFDHYMELKEVFMEGVDVIDRMNPTYVSDNDRKLKSKLQSAVDMINRRLEFLSDFSKLTENYGDLAKAVRAAGIHRTPLLTEGTDAKQEPQNSNPEGARTDKSDTTDIS
jgi:hypothetical protein